jgi:hypothetical protein
MLDEHAFLLGDGKEEVVEFFFVIFLERTQRALELVLQENFFGELLEFEFERHRISCSIAPSVCREGGEMSTLWKSHGKAPSVQAPSTREAPIFKFQR